MYSDDDKCNMRKYKIGDKVIIEERRGYGRGIINDLRKHNHVFTIVGFFSDKYYDMAENKGCWQDLHITGLASDDIDSRFEILDL
jgi:hypothetical protein